MKQLYIIAGPKGAGKTTASYTVLPEIFHINEFVNADEIAKGLSPFNPESVSFQAGRIMLNRIHELLSKSVSFGFETTLSTRSYVNFIKEARECGYEVILLFLGLDSINLAKNRVKIRVKEGGHNIPEDVIERQYIKGLSNFFELYMSIVDKWIFVNTSTSSYEIIAEGSAGEIYVKNEEIWENFKSYSHGS